MSDEVTFGQKLILAAIGSVAGLGVILAAVLTYFSSRRKNRIDAGSAANEAAVKIINELQEERELMRGERAAFHKERLEWNTERADYRKRLLDCEGHIRGLEQYIYSLENELRRQGIDIPPKREVQSIILLDNNCEAPNGSQ